MGAVAAPKTPCCGSRGSKYPKKKRRPETEEHRSLYLRGSNWPKVRLWFRNLGPSHVALMYLELDGTGAMGNLCEREQGWVWGVLGFGGDGEGESLSELTERSRGRMTGLLLRNLIQILTIIEGYAANNLWQFELNSFTATQMRVLLVGMNRLSLFVGC